MSVLVSTTYSIMPEAKTLAGYRAAIQALIAAGAPTTTLVVVDEAKGITISVVDPVVRRAISTWAER